jgi:hypothetical protein
MEGKHLPADGVVTGAASIGGRLGRWPREEILKNHF